MSEADTSTLSMEELRITCECGMDVTFESEQAVSRWQGMLFGTNDTLLGLCPECENIRFAAPTGTESGGAVTGHVALNEVAMTGDEAAGGTMHGFNRRIDELVGLDPDRLTRCPKCGACILHDHKHEGPGAPEIGWEYYECPDCTHTMHPEVVE